jgi:hypothetical protein
MMSSNENNDFDFACLNAVSTGVVEDCLVTIVLRIHRKFLDKVVISDPRRRQT